MPKEDINKDLTTLETVIAPFARLYEFVTSNDPRRQAELATTPYGSFRGEVPITEAGLTAVGLLDIPGVIGEEVGAAGGLPPALAGLLSIGVPGPEDISKAPRAARSMKELGTKLKNLPEKLKSGLKPVYDTMSGQVFFQDPVTKLGHGIGQIRPEEGILELTNVGKGMGERTFKAFDELAELLGLQVTRGTTQLKEEGARSLKKSLDLGHTVALQEGVPETGKRFPALSTHQKQGFDYLIDVLFSKLQGGS